MTSDELDQLFPDHQQIADRLGLHPELCASFAPICSPGSLTQHQLPALFPNAQLFGMALNKLWRTTHAY